MGLATKSSTEGYFFDDLGSTPLFERFMLHLANAFTQLASTRLTEKQRLLLFASNQILRYYPDLSPTALAERLSRKLGMPLSTTKFNLNVLKEASRYRDELVPDLRTKCGIMVGLGETTDQLVATIADIAETGCDIITIGQYLSPKLKALPVERFYTPEEFTELGDRGRELGIKHVESSPLVRSSYKAKEQWEKVCGISVR